MKNNLENLNTTASAPGQYMPVGWMHWPDNLDYSFQFLRVLGAAQEGASMIGECFLTAQKITPGDDETWYSEWTGVAEVNLKRATEAIALGHITTARMNWLRAANYFRCAEFFLDHNDNRRIELLDSLEACSQLYIKHSFPGGEVVKIPYENGAHLDAYYLPAPSQNKKTPTVICFGGLDEFKDELLHEMPKHAFPRGMSLLLVDLPGQGGTLRRQKLKARVDTEVPVSACVDYLFTRDDVDTDKIALYGASLGGYYAPRAASYEHRLSAVVSDGAIWDLHRSFISTKYDPDRIAVRHLHWVLGIEGERTEAGYNAVVEKLKEFRLKGVQDKIQCPYLITEGECDFAGFEFAVESYEYSKALGQDVTFKVFSVEDTGASHCQIDNPTLGQEYICDWLADKLGINQHALPKSLNQVWV
ncbi:MAG: alpha/beta hydrolase [Paraglaciecola sp.]|nr:alpha/beta hydrolase [Paraglaciecola sp.]